MNRKHTFLGNKFINFIEERILSYEYVTYIPVYIKSAYYANCDK